MPCTCIDKVNEKLAPLNGRVGLRFTFDAAGIGDTALLTVEKVNPRGKKPPGLLAKHCPFCGTAYTPPDTVPFEGEFTGKLPLPPGWEIYWTCLEVKERFETHLRQADAPYLRVTGTGRSEVEAWNSAIGAANHHGPGSCWSNAVAHAP